MSEPRAGSPQNLRTVEAARGLAALLVVIFHAAASIFPAQKYWNAEILGGSLNWGYAGVFFFFVLSGFIIAHVHARDIGEPSTLHRFALRRVVRIYPLYWLVLAGIIVLARVGVGDSAAPGVATILSSVLLIGPDNHATVVAVAWTLYHEILFYLVFAVWLVDRRLGLAVTVLWLALIAAAQVVALPLPDYVVAPVNLLFGFGVATWWVSRRGDVPLAGIVAGIAAIAFVAVGIDVVHWQRLSEPVHEQLFGIAAAVGLAAVVSLERRRPVAVPRLLMLLGAASYSIYLVHFPLLSLFAKICLRLGITAHVPVGIAFVGVVVVTVAAGIVVHRLVERPLLAAINGRVFPRRKQGRAWT